MIKCVPNGILLLSILQIKGMVLTEAKKLFAVPSLEKGLKLQTS